MLLRANASYIALKAKLMRGFADPSRLAIVEALRPGTLTVTEIVQATGLAQSKVSTHLACLRECGLVTAEQQGRFVRYQLSDPRVEVLLRLAEEVLADVAKGVYECTRYNSCEED